MENFELHNNHPRADRATAGGLHSRQGLWTSNDIVSTRDAVPGMGTCERMEEQYPIFRQVRYVRCR